MKTIILFAFILSCTVCVTIQALECGIDSSATQKDLRQITENCMTKKVETKKNSSSENNEEEEENKENPTEKPSVKRSKRDDIKSQINHQDSNVAEVNQNTTGKSNCVVQCIFNQMGMTDGSGFPEHHLVSQALLKNTKGRELRDFVQDTTDECFQLMGQGDRADPCQYSITLVTCLAERGKSNCADWPVGNLSFLTNKN